jgi:hypothetical protein
MGCDKDQSCLNSRKRVICSVVIQSELIDEREPLVTSCSGEGDGSDGKAKKDQQGKVREKPA